MIVGDVHACFDELQSLLQACAFDAAHDQLVFVGDLVNKGPKPVEVRRCFYREVHTGTRSCDTQQHHLQVVRFARESNALCVRGNHDDAALAAYYAWQASGGVAGESDPKYSYVEQLTGDDVQFLEQLPFTLTLPQFNTIVVHAGLVPGVALCDQRPIDMYKMRFLTQRRADETAESPPSWLALESRGAAPDTSGELHPWATQWRGPEHIVFGHDAVAGLQREAFATGLDTGCCYGRQLSACIFPVRH